jgi:hypothetical protein
MMPSIVGRSTMMNVDTMKYPIAKVSIPKINTEMNFKVLGFIRFTPTMID